MIDAGQLRQYNLAIDAADEAARRQAIHALKAIQEQEWLEAPAERVRSIVESLQRQLVAGSKQTFIRQEILVILGNIGAASEAAVPTLVDLLADGVADSIREEAATALGKIGKKAKSAVDPLVAMLPTCRTNLAMRVIFALGGIGGADQKVKAALSSLWMAADQSQHSQVQVAMALCKLKVEAKGLVAFLTRTLTAHQDSALRKVAGEALAFCSANETDVVPALLSAALHDKDEKVREKANESLTSLKLSQEKAINLCAKQLKDSIYAEAALRNSGALAIPVLVEALKEDDADVREKSLRILAGLGELAVTAVPAVTDALRAKDKDIRLAAAKCLWNITKNPDGPVPVLVHLLSEKWPAAKDSAEIRRRFLQTVIEALRRIGPPAQAAVPALLAKLSDENRLISESALSALKMIAPNSIPAP